MAGVATSAAHWSPRGGVMIEPHRHRGRADPRDAERPAAAAHPHPFAIPAYRRMAVALSCGAFAYGVWTVALVWEVIRLGGGPAQLSIVSTAGAVGVLLPALLAGVVADRIPQKLIVMTVATAEVVSYTVVTVLSLTDLTRLWHLARRLAAASAWGWRSTTRRTPPGCPRSCPSPTCSRSTASRAWCGRSSPQAIGPGVAGVVVGIASPGLGLPGRGRGRRGRRTRPDRPAAHARAARPLDGRTSTPCAAR